MGEDRLRDAILRYKQLLGYAEHQRDRLMASLDRLTTELTCPAMEHLNAEVRRAWGDSCDLLERIKSELQAAANPTATV